MSLSNPVSRRAHARTLDIRAFARMDDGIDGWRTDIKVNDTLLASGLREGGQPLQVLRLSSATQSNRSISTDPRWAAHAATTAQVPHD